MSFVIDIETPPRPETLRVIGDGLTNFNQQYFSEAHREFVVTLSAPQGNIRGGVFANAWAGMLFLKWVWLDAETRGLGHGSKLIQAAEEEGKRLGCAAAWLDTFEFQARPFYEKLGYVKFASLSYPAGFERYFMQKML